MLRISVMGAALAIMQVLLMGAAAVVSAQMLKLEGIRHDADLSFKALGRDLLIDPSLGRTRILNSVPRDQDPVAVMALALRDGRTGHCAAYADDRGLDYPAMLSDRYGDDSGPQALPVAEPSSLLLLGSAVIGLAATMRRYGKRSGHA